MLREFTLPTPASTLTCATKFLECDVSDPGSVMQRVLGRKTDAPRRLRITGIENIVHTVNVDLYIRSALILSANPKRIVSTVVRAQTKGTPTFA